MPTWDLSHSSLFTVQIISDILVGKWKAHWSYIFSSVSFCPASISDSTHKILIRFGEEGQLFTHQPL